MPSRRKNRRRGQKSRKQQKQQKQQKQRKQRAGGYSDDVRSATAIYPGQQPHVPYSGPGYDCPGVPVRPGTLDGIGSLRLNGVPGLQGGGGSTCGMTASEMIQGATQLGSGGPVLPLGVSVADGSQPGPYGSALTTPARELAPTPALYSQQRGGRWGAFPELGPLNSTNGVGTIGSPFLRQPCEIGTSDALNPNPGGVQQLSTAVGYVNGWTPYAPAMRGGSRKSRKHRKGKKNNGIMNAKQWRMNGHNGALHRTLRSRKQKQKQKGGVHVGQVDAMRYYAPTAGYDNLPLTPQVPNNPGILMQVGYPAGHFNEACVKTN